MFLYNVPNLHIATKNSLNMLYVKNSYLQCVSYVYIIDAVMNKKLHYIYSVCVSSLNCVCIPASGYTTVQRGLSIVSVCLLFAVNITFLYAVQ